MGDWLRLSSRFTESKFGLTADALTADARFADARQPLGAIRRALRCPFALVASRYEVARS